jgi:hypothetical protein
MTGSLIYGRKSPKGEAPGQLPLDYGRNNKHGYITIGYHE